MQDMLLGLYDWLKAAHVISAIFWMAGLLYLPRLFVYQIEAPKGGELNAALKAYQRLLLKRIMNAAMIATWLFALLMLWANPSLMTQGWMHAKLAAVIAMTVLHMAFARTRRLLEADEDVGTGRAWRLYNEAPAALAIVIVVMAIVEPF
ncbi:MAG: protoporphyrinogen oxidase HemJ [Pseudomonadota bacterium]